MADPILNEDMILAALSVPAALAVAEQLQEASGMALANAYDRKIERAPFIDLMNAALSMSYHMAKLQVTGRIRALMERDQLTKEKLDNAAMELIAFGEASRVKLYNMTERVSQCPTSLDKVS